jgi:hypothetical protein
MSQFKNEHHGAADQTSIKAALIKYGITHVPVDSFQVDGYRYSNLQDAVAQAKRAAIRKNDDI